MPAKPSDIPSLVRHARRSRKCFSKPYYSAAYHSMHRSTIVNMSSYRVKFLRCFFGICVTCYSLVRCADCNPDSDNCYSPSGADCDWYSRCFEAGLKQCSAEANFSGQFCRLWETNRDALSPEGRRWIDRVRSCQQTNLVPLLKQSQESNTCEVVRQQIATTQTYCYVSRSPSVCDLPLTDYYTNSSARPCSNPSRRMPSVKPTTCSRAASSSGRRLDRACEQSSSTSS